ncbi:MAG: UvrD-helicase domain-containing protein [Euryarchaeota archaeon]|nr:UvrD-helicase domain-containing protein [Euryarchaeota archaeon]MBU4222152.1 UvrD-helicase domain-containing protein [Euryarchaeota archaeon]
MRNSQLIKPLCFDKSRQLSSIKHTQSPQLILAGAGTGKTTTITAKIAYMVEKENIDPSQILALTFSKEAARNMREKVEKLLQGKEVIVKTFHSFCAELINERFQKFIREILWTMPLQTYLQV